MFPDVNARTISNCGVIVAGRATAVQKPLSDALSAAGMAIQRMVSRSCSAEEAVSRADTEGAVPVVVTWDACGDGVQLVLDMLACDALPGRAYVLVVGDDVEAAIAAERLEDGVPESVERVLVVVAGELGGSDTRALLRLHLSRAAGVPIEVTRRSSGVTAAPVTDFPCAERVIADIDRRNLLRGNFHVALLRTPRI